MTRTQQQTQSTSLYHSFGDCHQEVTLAMWMTMTTIFLVAFVAELDVDADDRPANQKAWPRP